MRKRVRARTPHPTPYQPPTYSARPRPSPDTLHIRRVLILVIVTILFVHAPSTAYDSPTLSVTPSVTAPSLISSDPGVTLEMSGYLIIQLQNGDIDTQGKQIASLLSAYGVATTVVNASDLAAMTDILDDPQAVILDPSCGSNDGALFTSGSLDLLVQRDLPLILIGRAAWLLHRLRGSSPPSTTAPLTDLLQSSTGYSGAVFLTSPIALSLGTTTTLESGLLLPLDWAQTSESRIVDLVASESSSFIAPLRHCSYPNDIFLFGPENVSLLTQTGEGLLVNTVAYATSLSETSTSATLAMQQSPPGSTLEGGFHYSHTPTIESTYYVTHSLQDLMATSEFDSWRANHSSTINHILSLLEVSGSGETSFKDSVYEDASSLRATARGLWLIETMGLTSYYDTGQIVAYLAARQDTDGGFESNIDVTFNVVEALHSAGSLGSIDTDQLEWWLRDCVVTGSDTSDTNQWGGVAQNPSGTIAANSYAAEYLVTLWHLGKAHTDPQKLTEWIQDTSNGDGSFRDIYAPDQRATIGTASALTSMSILGTLDAGNKTAGMSWFSSNQLPSGSFGIGLAQDDILAKTWAASAVASCLEHLSETSGPTASGIISYCQSVSSAGGYEPMEPAPTLLWSYWLSRAARFSHSDQIDRDAFSKYLSYFYDSGFAMYPAWGNVTKTYPPEYNFRQFYDKGVWAQYLGVASALGQRSTLPASVISDITMYLSLRQQSSGHYRPSTMGTASMQYTAAAVEALYRLGEMDTIGYRSALESAVMAEYSAGQWSMASWNLQPFSELQSAIDYLSTRTASRLGLVDDTMAAALSSNINGRVQYGDLWALSWDVSTLSLLNESGFSVDLESIDTEPVLTALGSHFESGWFNDSPRWQPVYTSKVLEMVSILGLRPRLVSPDGTTVTATVPATSMLGGDLDIHVNITSSEATHTVYVHAFDTWTRFDNVLPSDTLYIPIPSTESALGPNTIHVMVSDYGLSRGFDAASTDVLGQLEGSMNVTTPEVLVGDLINGTLEWALQGGGDAGACSVSIVLSNATFTEEYGFVEQSVFPFSIPTSGKSSGEYNLTATVTRSQCEDLVLRQPVTTIDPVPTYLTSTVPSEGVVGEDVAISWTLRYAENDTGVSGETVTLEIRDEGQAVVYSDLMTSTGGLDTFVWSPDGMGVYSVTLRFDGRGALVASHTTSTVTVYEDTDILWTVNGTGTQHSTVPVVVLLETSSGQPLPDRSLSITVFNPLGTAVLDTTLITNSSGHVFFEIALELNGLYDLHVQFNGDGLLRPSNSTTTIVSWSQSGLEMGGITSDTQTSQSHTLWALLTDSVGSPVQGATIIVSVTYLPSTVVLHQTLVTNSSGYVSVPWSATNPGDYLVEFIFEGTPSRESTTASMAVTARVETLVSVSVPSYLEVGQVGWICINITDDRGVPVDVQIEIVVRDVQGTVVFMTTGQSVDGLLNLTWTPGSRGANNITATADRQSWYEASQDSILAGVFERPTVAINFTQEPRAPDGCGVVVSVTDLSGDPVAGASVRTTVLLEGVSILDYTNLTAADGTIHLVVGIDSPGSLQVNVTLGSQGWLLDVRNSTSALALGTTSLLLDVPGQPIEQGTTLGITVTLTDWTGSPLSGAPVNISVLWSNGTVLDSVIVFTGAGGSCSTGHTFTHVGDFWIKAVFDGLALNSSAEGSQIQRVRVTPSLSLDHSPTALTGETTTFSISVTDAFGDPIEGRSLVLSVSMNGSTVYEVTFLSSTGSVVLEWIPSQRGLTIITLTHSGDEFYLTNMTTTSMSVLTLVSGDLALEDDEVDIFGSTVIHYDLTGPTVAGVEIAFQVLGMDLVPVWSGSVITDSLGLASIQYTADDSHGILLVVAAPAQDEFMIGGDSQVSLRVWTQAHVQTEMYPSPPTTGTPLNVSVLVTDDLGFAIDGLRVAVSVYDIYNARLFTVYRDLDQGLTVVQFTPTQWGIYRVQVSSNGAETVHAFTTDLDDHMHTVYCPTDIVLEVTTPEVEVGDTLSITARLENVLGDPLVDMSLNLTLVGDITIGPVTSTTDSKGEVHWDIVLDEQGFWELRASFFGLGTYLPVETVVEIHSCYGTSLEVAMANDGDVVAGQGPINVSVLLMDSVGSPLEGRTITWEAYHDEDGMFSSGSLVQQGVSPETVLITVAHGGNITVVFYFAGSDHYHSCNAAVEVLVKGTSEIILWNTEVDRSNSSPVVVQILDELGQPMFIDTLQCTIHMYGELGEVSLEDRLVINGTLILLNTTALPVGDYDLNVSVAGSHDRIGTEVVSLVRVTTQTVLSVISMDAPGLVGVPHSIDFALMDSLGNKLDGYTCWISLYHPDGREIYGGLGDSTPVVLADGHFTVSWTPTSTGNYSLVVRFVGDSWTLDSEWSEVILTRRSVTMEVSSVEEVDYAETVEITVTLSSGLFDIPDGTILVRVETEGGMPVLTVETQTNSRGVATVSISDLRAGEYTVVIQYVGSEELAPTHQTILLKVLPRVVLTLQEDAIFHAGMTGSVSITSQVMGLSEYWNGTLSIIIYDPEGGVFFTTSWVVSSTAVRSVEITPLTTGVYTANITLGGLPVIGLSSSQVEITVSGIPMELTLDAGTTPLAVALPIVSIIGLVLRKRFGVDLPTEWTGM
ncbi:MAG: hypothetical protein DRO87_05150 [Candidatus Thorarchaeota archaeon]|nr:MAG: hypothetical protein DRO87_05150 [Candidatus Thorarchaeota archaeon]